MCFDGIMSYERKALENSLNQFSRWVENYGYKAYNPGTGPLVHKTHRPTFVKRLTHCLES